ncbi:cytochrome P450 [Antrihabitans sp. YC2-6]|uniref:cytochrome P450 n=1 Tax=Antrihabitans sp. YC2-6 TaxID=2799498 RepID=UPI0018F78B17|nr:cytochrome P450 [Antrihabitans sp. YC2-6]MBJ8344054.1 cytochrome P450 [Antrihabitans sp. YC2-6]
MVEIAVHSNQHNDSGYRLPPGPGARGIRDLYSVSRYLVDYLRRGEVVGDELIERYGDTFTVCAPGSNLRAVVVSDPDLIKQIFTAKPDVLLGGKGVSPSAVIYGSGSMFVQEEPEHLRRRKMLTPGFNGSALQSYQDTIVDVAERAVARWPVGQPFSMLEAARELTLEIIMRVVFGIDDSAELAAVAPRLERLLAYGVSEQIVLRYLTRRAGTVRYWRGLNKATVEVHDVLQALIDRRRSQPESDRRDILALLMGSETADGQRLSDQELRDDLITLLLAGHETTATTLAWIFDHLVHDRQLADRLTVDATTGDTEYCDAVIAETLRMRPVVVGTARVTAQPFRLGEWLLPADTWIVAYIRGVNHRAATYPDPHRFRPERFLHSSPNTFAWIPFGGGAKRCLGAAFAQTELRTVLRVLLTRAEFAAADPNPDTPVRRGPVMLPRSGVRLSITRKYC